MALVYGQGGNISVMMAGPFAGGGGSSAKVSEVALPASGWKNGESPFYQNVTVDGISVNSIVELMPNEDIIGKLHHTALMAVNEDGAVTVYAYGDKPEEDMVIKAVLMEVVAV